MKSFYHRIILRLSIVATFLFLIAAIAISWDGLHDKIVAADLAIVLGNEVIADGSPSPRLQGRLDAALNLYTSGYCKAIFVSGGIGRSGFDEAEVMKSYLVTHGVPEAVIYTDNKGVNTYETARNAAQFIRSRQMDKVVVVSQFFHISRTRMALRKFGVKAAGNIHATYYEIRDIYSTLREVVAYIAYSLKRS